MKPIYCPACGNEKSLSLEEVLSNPRAFLELECEDDDCCFSFFLEKEKLLPALGYHQLSDVKL